jgi:hypothetical protein
MPDNLNVPLKYVVDLFLFLYSFYATHNLQSAATLVSTNPFFVSFCVMSRIILKKDPLVIGLHLG